MAYNQAMALLSSKLRPPRTGAALYRKRLIPPTFKERGGAPPVRLIQIIAGAGFGKTTLATQLLARDSALPAWYRLDEFDRDFSLFAAYLTRAVETAAPDIAFAFPPAPAPAMAAPDQLSWMVAWLAALEEVLDRPLQMVLDDYHLADQALNPMVEFLLEHLPPDAGIILVSRREPGLKISRLRASLGVVDIREEDLAFTPEETRSFFSAMGPAPSPAMAPEALSMIQEKTNGWAAGLALFSCTRLSGQMGEAPFGNEALQRLPDSPREVFTYLEENIFEHLSSGERDFMVKTALLSSMEPEFCDRVLDIRDSANRFKDMADHHLMVFPLAGEKSGFYYHQLLREFLLSRAPDLLGKEEICRLHRRAADILAEKTHPLALHHYIQAQAYDRASELLTTLETQLLLMGQMPFVKTCLDTIPPWIRDQHPQLLFMAAKQQSYYGDPHQAIAILKRAEAGFRKQGDALAQTKCLADLGAQYYYVGRIPRARQLLEQALEQTPADAPTFILIMTYLVFLTAVLGDMAASRAHEKRSRNALSTYPPFMEKAARILINTSVTYREYITGQFRASVRRNRELILGIKKQDLPACMPLARYQSAVSAYVLDAFQAGIHHAQKGLAAAAKIHLRDSQKGWLYLAWAENNLGLGEWDLARKHAQRGMDIFQGQDNHWGQAYGRTLMAEIHLAQGQWDEARDQTTAAVAHLRDRGLDFQASLMGLTRVRTDMTGGCYDIALERLQELLPALEPAPHAAGLAQLLEIQCRQALGEMDPEQAHGRMEKILARGREPGWDTWAKKRLIPRKQKTEKRIPGLDIGLMGPFRLRVGDRTLPPAAWTHGNALALFKYLAAHQDQGYLPKDLLLEILWPGQDPDKTGKRFNVAVSRLRKTLEPDLPPKAPSSYIRRHRDQYRLDMGPSGRCDLLEFLSHARAAKSCGDPLRAKEHALEAAAAYAGPFLEDTRYQDWSLRTQEELAREYGRVLKQLIEFHRAKGPDRESRHWLKTYLELDPFEESFYPPLMTLLAKQGRYDQVRYWFDRCATAMAEMDCPVGPETRNCFEALMAQRPSA